MLKAIVKEGAIVPLEPLPLAWRNGTALSVEADEVDADPLSTADAERLAREADEWYREMEEAAAQLDPRDAAIIDAAIQDMDRIAKEQMRREMGLP